VRIAVRTVATAGGLLTLLLAAGCGVPAGPALSRAHQATIAGCASYGVRAIERHVVVTRVPVPCQGLSRAEINQAAAMAVRRVAGSAPKAVARRRAGAAAPYLAHLVTAPAAGRAAPAAGRAAPAASSVSGSSISRSAASGPAASGPASGQDLPMDLAALAAWLVTAGSGAYLLRRWMSRGGRLRSHAASTTASTATGTATGTATPPAVGAPAAVLLGHFGLALGGLLLWLAYLVTGWPALAWAAVGVLLPVAGLGMATLVVGLPRRSPVPADHGAPVLAGRALTRPQGAIPDRAGHPDATEGGDELTVPSRLPALAVAAHGLLAMTVILLVMLAALGSAAR
jgi:hypothetical protein